MPVPIPPLDATYHIIYVRHWGTLIGRTADPFGISLRDLGLTAWDANYDGRYVIATEAAIRANPECFEIANLESSIASSRLHPSFRRLWPYASAPHVIYEWLLRHHSRFRSHQVVDALDAWRSAGCPPTYEGTRPTEPASILWGDENDDEVYEDEDAPVQPESVQPEQPEQPAQPPQPPVSAGGYVFMEAERALKDPKEIRRWVNWVRSQVRIGIELEKGGTASMSAVRTALRPTNTFERLNAYNVSGIHEDGSVSGSGIEILVCGNIEDFHTAWRKMKALHDLISERWGLRADRTCGMHYHIVAAQDEADMPEIILKNFYQLCRMYYPGLLYLTGTAGDWTRGILRDSRMQYFFPTHLNVTPIGTSMDSVWVSLQEEHSRYTAFNMGGGGRDLMGFGINRTIARFHVELRFPDASDSPAQITAQQVLFRAMLIKAVELSRFGVVSIKDSDVTEMRVATECLAVGETCRLARYRVGSSRRSTAPMPDRGFEADRNWEPLSEPMTFEAAKEYAKRNAKKLLTLLRSTLKNIGGGAIPVLDAIVENPVWARRKSGNRWGTIESALMPTERVLGAEADKLLQVILSQEIVGEPIMRHWEHKAAEKLQIPEKHIGKALGELRQEMRIGYDKEVGTYVVEW